MSKSKAHSVSRRTVLSAGAVGPVLAGGDAARPLDDTAARCAAAVLRDHEITGLPLLGRAWRRRWSTNTVGFH
jgi:hypothetical protein